MRPAPKRTEGTTQQLSCREGGQFDRKFHTVVPATDGGSPSIKRRPVTAWGAFCEHQEWTGKSRRARIVARKEGGQ